MTDAASTGRLLLSPVSPGDPLMWADFQSLCDLGGRVAGSASEAVALAFARQRLAAVPGAKVRDDPVEYPGWRCRMAQLTSAMTGVSLQCTPLLGTASAAGIVAEVLDVGLGRREDFERHENRIRGRIVMVRHEYPFATGHVHCRVKLGLAQQMGAVGRGQQETEIAVGCVEPGEQPDRGYAVSRKIGVVRIGHERQVRRDRQTGARGGLTLAKWETVSGQFGGYLTLTVRMAVRHVANYLLAA